MFGDVTVSHKTLKAAGYFGGPFEVLAQHFCEGPVISVDVTPDAKTIVAASCDRRLYVLNNSGQPLLEPPLLEYEAWSVAISADASTIVTGTAQTNPSDGSIYIFHRDGHILFHRHLGAPVWSVSTSANGERVVAATWDNVAYVFEKHHDGYSQREHTFRAGRNGFYGIRLTRDGSTCFVASYGVGIFVLDSSLNPVLAHRLEVGLYNLAATANGTKVIVGGVDGRLHLFSPDKPSGDYSALLVCRRPICGVAVSDDGVVLFAGSFDGRAYLCGQNGRTYWSYQTQGEVWSTALSADGSIAVIGSGDNVVTIIRNNCTSTALRTIIRLEPVRLETGVVLHKYKRLLDAYEQTGLLEYGVETVSCVGSLGDDASEIDDLLIGRLQHYLSMYPEKPYACYLLAALYAKKGVYTDAVKYSQLAARDVTVRRTALTLTSKCFLSLGLDSAAAACQLQGPSVDFDDSSRMVLYNLARSHEDRAEYSAAISIYEALVAWDITYRNALDRLLSLKRIQPNVTDGKYPDFTGLNLRVLNPDIPRNAEVDKRLQPMINARTQELEPIRQRRDSLQDAWRSLWHRGLIASRHDASGDLSHNLASYVKYDFSPPEDEIKKRLELVSTIAVVQRERLKGRSLDIGTATGRYPAVLSRLGFRSIGVDIESEAIKLAKKKLSKGDAEPPSFGIADGRSLPFKDESFTLITCMMGTLNYVPRDHAHNILKELFRCCEINGLCIVSTWDPECPFLTFLAMYDARQKQRLATNLLSQAQMRVLMSEAGYSDVWVQPIGLLPDVLHYDLGLDEMKPKDVLQLIEIELAAEAVTSRVHGQLFLTVGSRREK